MSWLSRVWQKKLRAGFRPTRKHPDARRPVPAVEPLDERIMPAIKASFFAGKGFLTVFGDAANNTVVVSRDATGRILVNGGAVTISGGTPTVANTGLIQVF